MSCSVLPCVAGRNFYHLYIAIQPQLVRVTDCKAPGGVPFVFLYMGLNGMSLLIYSNLQTVLNTAECFDVLVPLHVTETSQYGQLALSTPIGFQDAEHTEHTASDTTEYNGSSLTVALVLPMCVDLGHGNLSSFSGNLFFFLQTTYTPVDKKQVSSEKEVYRHGVPVRTVGNELS